MNAGARDSGLRDEMRDHSLAASHAKLSGLKVGRTAHGGASGLSSATLAIPEKDPLISLIDTTSHRTVSNDIYP